MPSLVSTKTTTTALATASMLEVSKEKEKMPSAQVENMSGDSKPLGKGECLMVQAHSMRAMILEGSSEARDSLLEARYRINNAKATNIEIMNINIVVELCVSNEQERKRKVVEFLGMK